jgi:radical SAM superfamily enzyme YgiQ (UPF0313 family)
MKSLEELIQLKANALGILYLGVETGDEELLKKICKGTSRDHLIRMGRKVREAGIKLSVTVLLGIGGREGSLRHARATGELLSAMDPNYVGALTVMLIPGTPLYEEWKGGEFQLPNQQELLAELREMIAYTNLSRGLFFSNHASNYLPIKARMPGGKQEALDLIDGALRGEVSLRPEWSRAL